MAAGIYNFTIEQGATFTRIFKYKQADGDAFKIGYDRQVGKDLNQFEINPDDDGVVFFWTRV